MLCFPLLLVRARAEFRPRTDEARSDDGRFFEGNVDLLTSLPSSLRERLISSRCLFTASYSTIASTLSSCSLCSCYIADRFSSNSGDPVEPLGRHELAGGGDEVLCVRISFDYALQRLRASWSRLVLLLKRTPETRADFCSHAAECRRAMLTAPMMRNAGLVRPQAHARTIESELPRPARLDSERKSDSAVTLVSTNTPAAPSPWHFLCNDWRSDRQTRV